MLFCYLLRRGVVVGPDEELCHDEVLPQSQQGFTKSGIVVLEKVPKLPSLKLILATENRPSQKEGSFPTTIFQGLDELQSGSVTFLAYQN